MKRFELFTKIKLYVERISLNGIEDEREGREELENDPTSGQPSPAPNPGTVAKKFANFRQGKVERQTDTA
jgi:hypothetical protein